MQTKRLALYVWNGGMTNVRIPEFMESDVSTWNDVDKYFTKRNFHPNDIWKKFLNQIRSKTINNNPINQTMQNQMDA